MAKIKKEHFNLMIRHLVLWMTHLYDHSCHHANKLIIEAFSTTFPKLQDLKIQSQKSLQHLIPTVSNSLKYTEPQIQDGTENSDRKQALKLKDSSKKRPKVQALVQPLTPTNRPLHVRRQRYGWAERAFSGEKVTRDSTVHKIELKKSSGHRKWTSYYILQRLLYTYL